MKPFNKEMIDPGYYRNSTRKPDINNLLQVLRRKRPGRPTLFELFLNEPLAEKLAGPISDPIARNIESFHKAGYDYVTALPSNFAFPSGQHATSEGAKTISLSDGFCITDRESFEDYQWMEVGDSDFSALDAYAEQMPDGMKMMVVGPCGVLENVISLAGYENLCMMLADDPELVQDLFDHVGSRLVQYYEKCVSHEAVGIQMINDDWGFKTQTMLSTDQMREYVVPWHKKIAEAGHRYGKPVVMHSCGNLERVYDDIIDVIKFDGKHSYEDTIIPVEDAYERYGGRIAIMGGIDVDFLCRSEPEKIYNRCTAMLERTRNGGYALGSGNSVPYYVPHENYYAMIAAAHFNVYD
ncbi:MAG: uroporphyrinogen decarboxylase family protein [Oscillospiraceae bacterium]|nr:uroporphyrinogen decarboxylase family protein [Oscillospiraceae bacterium]